MNLSDDSQEQHLNSSDDSQEQHLYTCEDEAFRPLAWREKSVKVEEFLQKDLGVVDLVEVTLLVRLMHKL